MNKSVIILSVCFGLGIISFPSMAQSTQKPNVLFITIYDMNDWTTVFDDPWNFAEWSAEKYYFYFIQKYHGEKV